MVSDSTLPARAWLVVALLWVVGLLNYLDRQTLSILKATLKTEFVLTDIHYSWLVTAFMGPYIVFYVISGRLVDRFGTRASLSAFAARPEAYFKFVISAPEDLAEVLALQENHAIPAARIFLMAEGTDSETLRQRDKWLAPLCLTHGLRLSDRLHIHLYGDTRGT